MALRSGLAAQLGVKAESTFGTYIAPDRFYEFDEEDLSLSIERVQSAALRAGNRVQRTDRWQPGARSVEGSVSLPVMSKSMGLLLLHMLGTVAITTPGGAVNTRRHTHTLGDTFGLSLTCQVGRPDTGGTVRPFSFLGCKVAEWELTQEVDELLMLELSLDAADQTTAQALATASYPAGLELFSWDDCAILVGGAAFEPKSLSLSGSNGLKTDRYLLRSSTVKKEQLLADHTLIEGELVGEFESLTAYDRFVDGTIAAVQLTWTGSLIETTFNYKLDVVLPACRFDDAEVRVQGPDVLEVTLPFVVLNNGTDEPISVIYDTTDTAS